MEAKEEAALVDLEAMAMVDVAMAMVDVAMEDMVEEASGTDMTNLRLA